MLCPTCGNEIDEGQACPVCSEGAAWTKPPEEIETPEPSSFLCTTCGNDVVGEKECPVCRAGRAPSKVAVPEDSSMTFCPGCGNEVENVQRCPICRSGRSSGGKAAGASGELHCPRCEEPLEEQDWEGVNVHLCPTCNGSFFPRGGLEATLDKLRAQRGTTDLATACREFRDRFTRELPEAMRYKLCPMCDTVMTRSNYAGSSGIILDLCGHHGTWVDQAAFGPLTDFISRGGDLIQSRRRRR